MVARSKRILVVAADGAHARFYETARLGEPLKELEEWRVAAACLPPPRVYHHLGPAPHAGEPRRSLRATAETRFARRVADVTDQLARRFDQLVVCAAPAALRVIRGRLSNAAACKLTAEITEDYMRQTPLELSAALAEATEES